MNRYAKWALIVLFAALVILGILYYASARSDSGTGAVSGSAPAAPSDMTGQTAGDTAKAITATFSCADHRSITAVFTPNQVQLTLSDGRTLTLPQALSADGGRYANTDESFVFWNKGNTAFVTENGTNTYDSCTTTLAP